MKPTLGSGARFATMKRKLAGEPTIKNPGAVAAAIGRKKYGFAQMKAMAAKGKRKG